MPAKLVVKAGLTDKKEYALMPGRAYFIGRSREAEVIVKDQQASRRHCAIEASADDKWTLTDQDSSNGTHLNGQRIKTRPLKDGDEVRVGKTLFEFSLPGAVPKAKPTDEDTILVGKDAKPRAEAPAAKPAAAPPKKAETEEDLKELFSFLDKLDAGERPADDQGRKADAKPSAPHEPPPARPVKASDDDSSLFALVDEAVPAKEAAPPSAPAEEPQKKGGLLDFLRKKKKPS